MTTHVKPDQEETAPPAPEPSAPLECPKCGGSYCLDDYKPGICRHCVHADVPAVEGGTLCAVCMEDDQICPECGYPLGS